jgi:hypothetical protein
MSEYKKVFIIENYADNGEFSHYSLTDGDGYVLCSEEDKEKIESLESQLQERDNAFQEKLKDIIKEIQERRPDIIKDKYFAGLDDGFEVSTMILDKHINLTPKQDPKQS